MVSTTRAEPPRLTAAATLPYGELARGTRRGRRRRAERTDQQLILHARSAWMQDEGIARETIAMSMLWRCLVGSRSRFHSAGSRTALTGVSCWPRLALALRAPPSLWSFWT